MKKIILIACLLAIFAVSSAMAAEGNWRLYITTSSPEDTGASSPAQYGTNAAAAPGFNMEAAPGADVSGTTIWNVGVTDPWDGKIYARLWKPADAVQMVWDIRVGALPQSTYEAIKLKVSTVGAAVLPPGGDWTYSLLMVDNKGVAGAPANGTAWDIPVPAVHPTDLLTIQLPMLKLTGASAECFDQQGYKMQLVATNGVIPEPSSMLALGTGLVGLAGFVVRRRRA